MKESEFIRLVRDDLASENVNLIIGRGKQINCDGIRVDGYFSDYARELRVARGCKQWLGTLCHEYAHFRQWIEGCKHYQQSTKAIQIIDTWFSGKEYSERELSRAFRIVRTMERDAERRTAEMIERYSLPVDLNLYIKRANCYIYAHFIMERHRKFWAFSRDPFRSRVVLNLMPNDFRCQSHHKLPPDIDSALESLV